MFTEALQYPSWSDFNDYDLTQQRYREATDSLSHLCNNTPPGMTLIKYHTPLMLQKLGCIRDSRKFSHRVVNVKCKCQNETIIVSKMTSHCASTQREKRESEIGIGKLEKMGLKTRERRSSVCSGRSWNSLDQEMVDAPSINGFKGRLDKLRHHSHTALLSSHD